MREPDLDTVNRALSASLQKEMAAGAAMRKALLEAADNLERAGWRGCAERAREAAR